MVACLMPGYGIGYQGSLPWRLSKEMKYFRQLTSATRDSSMRNAVVMGRKTWESIPAKFRPLPNRLNVVVSRNCQLDINDEQTQFTKSRVGDDDDDDGGDDATLYAGDLSRAIDQLIANSKILGLETIYIIGGGDIYRQCIPMSHNLFITKIVPDLGMPVPPMDTFLDREQIESQFKEQPHHKLQEIVPKEVSLPQFSADSSSAPTISEKGFTYSFTLWSRDTQ